MKFYKEGIFHIYNQGNDKRQIFFSDEHYYYFLWKMKIYLQPYGDLISFCLMPNHFHWQFFVRKMAITRGEFRLHKDKMEMERREIRYDGLAFEIIRPKDYYDDHDNFISLNKSIGILLCSYSKALNKSMGCTGTVFRQHSKAKNGWSENFTNSINGSDQREIEGTILHNYISKCMQYIHENPVKAGIVKDIFEYPWSSAREYLGTCKDGLCDTELGLRLCHDVVHL